MSFSDSFGPLTCRALRRARAASVVAFCGLAPLSIAQVVSPPSQRLEPVVVTGSREPQPLARVVADVVVIDSDRIRHSSADSIEDLLRREAGIALSRSGGPGQTASVMIRGGFATNTVVLIDGVRVGSATVGQTDLSSLNLAQVERIEVLRGPGSSLYGADAIGGVVQIFTKRGTGEPTLDAHLARGGLGSSEANLAFGGAAAGFDYAVSGSHEASAGISTLKPGDAFGNYNPDRDGFRRSDLQLRGGLMFAPGHRVAASVMDNRLNAQYDGADFLPPNFVQDASGDFRNRFDTRVASLDYRGVVSPLWTTTLQLSEQRDDTTAGAAAPSRYRTMRRQLTWQNALNLDDEQRIVVAAEHQNQDVIAPYSAPSQRDNALVLGYSARFGAQRLQLDWRRDDDSAWGGISTGKLGWAVDLAEGLSLRAVAGTAFRAPSFNELYYPGYGVTTIRPERSRSVELGLNWRDDRSSVGATLYRNKVRDLIASEGDGNLCPGGLPVYPFGCARNLNRARLQGASFDAAQTFDTLTVRATLDFLDAHDEATGQRLQRRAAHQESLAGDWDLGAWTLGAALLRVGARSEGGAVQAAYTTLDLQARWRVARQWQIETKLLNATDRTYEVARDYPGLPRQAWLGLRYTSAGL